MFIEHLGAISAIEPLDKDVLIRLARLDIADRNAFGSSRFGKDLGDHLRAVIQAYCVGKPIAIDEATQDANQAWNIPASMLKHSRFASSITFRVRNRRPQ